MSNRKGSVPTSGPKVPSITIDHGTSQSNMSAYDKNVLSPNLRSNSLQRRSAIHTHYGKSPVSLSPHDQTIKFDYNVFVTTWQDQIKMRQYDNCEKYCREELIAAEDQQQLVNAFGNFTANNLNKTKSEPYTNYNNNNNNDNNNELEDEDLHTLLEYRSKVHFSLAYLLKKYFKRYDEAREQYQESIKTDRENPGAHFNLANMLVDHYRDYETAQYHFEKAIALEPTYSLYRMTYAEFLWHDCDRYKQSAIQYEELIKSNKDNEDIFFNYGLLLRDHLKNIPKAMEQFKCVMKLNPDDNEAIEEYNYTKSLNKKNTKKINIQMDPNDNMDEKEKNDKVVFNDGDFFSRVLEQIEFSQLGSYDNDDKIENSIVEPLIMNNYKQNDIVIDGIFRSVALTQTLPEAVKEMINQYAVIKNDPFVYEWTYDVTKRYSVDTSQSESRKLILTSDNTFVYSTSFDCEAYVGSEYASGDYFMINESKIQLKFIEGEFLVQRNCIWTSVLDETNNELTLKKGSDVIFIFDKKPTYSNLFGYN